MSSGPHRGATPRHLRIHRPAAGASAERGASVLGATVTSLILGACMVAALSWTVLPPSSPAPERPAGVATR